MGFPTTLQEFQAAFPDEQACWETLRRARWPKGFVCPRCGHQASSWIATRRLEQCCRCRYQCSVTAGTVFHRTRVPLLTWFWAIFFVARHKKGISALKLQRDTGLGSYKTAWSMLHRLRSALRHRPESRLAGLVDPVSVSLVRVPVFHGYAAAIWVRLAENVEPEAVAKVLKASRNITVAGSGKRPRPAPTPVGIAESNKIHVGPIRRDGSVPEAYWLWLEEVE